MAFKTNDYQQITITDTFLNLSPRTRRIVEKSWAKDFADIVFPAINEERFSVLYSDHKFSRPNTPVNIIVGGLILKESMDLTDDELIESICCDVRFQYALHTTHLDDQPVSDRTFSRFREKVYHYSLEHNGCNLFEEEMKHLTEVYAKYMNLNSNVRRMDSLMIASRCKRMSRLEIIYTVTANAVKLLHRLGQDFLLKNEMLHYLDEDDCNKIIYHCKGEDVTDRLKSVIADAVYISGIMKEDAFCDFQEYMLLTRVLNEQTDIDDDGNIIPKKNKDITTDSLQNPSDPDATFREKAGKQNKGYVGNIVETVGENGDSLITEFQVEQNTHSDSQFCQDYLEKRDGNSKAEILITDGAYGGKKNREKAASVNTTLVTTALTGKAIDPFFGDFAFTENGKEILRCPMGHSPLKTTYYPKTGMCRALFARNCCDKCPHKDKCHPREQKKNYAVHVSKSMAERAAYLRQLSTEAYKKYTNLRNAVEGIPSVMRRKYHIDDLPVFGLNRTRMAFAIKVGAYNFKKLLKHNRNTGDNCAHRMAFC